MSAPERLSEAEVAELTQLGSGTERAWYRSHFARNALPRLLAERRALLDMLERHWKVIDDAMPYIPGSSFVAGEIDALESERRALLAPQKESL